MGAFISIILMGAAPPQANCQTSGKLIFLGKTNDLSRSVWLSRTSAGMFQLETQGQQVVDQWTRNSSGLHISLSPFVSQGSGGTHFLIDAKTNRKLDSQNQKGGLILPPVPGLPPGVLPPIGILPPGGITPGLPTIPAPPIGVIPPPGGVIPPPGGVIPPPGGVIPPPGGVIPPPGGVIPPPGGVTPPGGITPPVGVIPPGTVTPGIPNQGTTGTRSNSSANDRAPITEARQFSSNRGWNIWSNNRYFDVSDGRYNLDQTGNAKDFSIGGDKRLSQSLVAGMLLAYNGYSVVAFNGGLNNKADGFSFGPYFGYQLSKNWALDGSMTYGELSNKNKLSVLSSSYKTRLVSASLRATSVYNIGGIQLRPKPLISLSHFRNPAYVLKGTVRNRAIMVLRDKDSYNFNFVQFMLEANKTFYTQNRTPIQPYAEIGADYQFSRPSEGQVLTGNFTLATASPTIGTATAGIRIQSKSSLFIDVSGSYVGVGQNGLNIWGGKLLVSYSFA